MERAIWGSFAALFLGGADSAARFSGRALGAPSAMLGVVAVGSVPLSFAVLGGSEFPPIAPAGLLRIAWLVLQGAMGRVQWMGVVLVFAGIGVPAAWG